MNCILSCAQQCPQDSVEHTSSSLTKPPVLNRTAKPHPNKQNCTLSLSVSIMPGAGKTFAGCGETTSPLLSSRHRRELFVLHIITDTNLWWRLLRPITGTAQHIIIIIIITSHHHTVHPFPTINASFRCAAVEATNAVEAGGKATWKQSEKKQTRN